MKKLLSYEEYVELIPKETKEFIDTLLPFFDYHITGDRRISLKNDYSITETTSKKMALVLLELDRQKDTEKSINLARIMLNDNNFKSSVAKLPSDYLANVKTISTNLSDIFTTYASDFCFFIHKENYMKMTPERLISNFCTTFTNKYGSGESAFNTIFNNNDYRTFKEQIGKYADKLEAEKHNEIRDEFIGDLPIETVKYIEYVAKIYAHIKNIFEDGSYKNDLINCMDDIITVSALLALNYVPNSAIEIFEAKGIEVDKYKKMLGLNFSQSDINKESAWYTVISKIYNEFIFGGKNKDVEADDITIEKIARNLFDRKLNNSLIFEKILLHCSSSPNEFQDFDKLVEEYKNKKEANKTQNDLKLYYKNLPLKTIDFVELISQLYSIISKQMYEKTLNPEIIKSDEDVIVLSILLAAFYFENNTVMFYEQNGLSLETVLSLVNLKIDSKELETTIPNYNAIMNIFKRFIFEGSNKNIDSKEITADHIIKNICNREFNNSLVIEVLFKEAKSKAEITTNFKEYLEEFIKNKSKETERELEQKVYAGMSPIVIEYFEKASRIFNFILEQADKEKLRQLSKEDIVELALLAALENYKSDAIDYLKTKAPITSIYNLLNANGNPLSYQKDINMISTLFKKYMGNTDEESIGMVETTIDSVAKKIFNRKIHSSVSMTKFLHQLNCNYKDFDNIDQKIEENRKRKVKEQVVGCCSKTTIPYLETTTSIHHYLNNIVKLKPNDILKTEEDIKQAALFLAYISSESISIKLLADRGITFVSCLEFLGLEKEKFDEYKLIEPDYKLIQNFYKEYINDSGWNSPNKIEDVLSKVFKPDNNKSSVIKQIIDYSNTNYDEVIEEIAQCEKVVKPLSPQDQIKKFCEADVPELSQDSIEEITVFGKELGIHTGVIASIFSKQLTEKELENRKLNDIQNTMKSKAKYTQKKKFGFMKPKKISFKDAYIDSYLLDTIKIFLTEEEEAISTSISDYEYLKKLIALYFHRVLDYLVVIKDVKKSITADIDAKNYAENDMRNQEAFIKLQLIDDKINYLNSSILTLYEEYKKLNSRLVSLASTKTKITVLKETSLPIVYIDIKRNDGTAKTGKSVDTITQIYELIEEISAVNKITLTEEIPQIDGLLKNNGHIIINTSTQEQIDNILEIHNVEELMLGRQHTKTAQ